jgi:hypothetical protein
MPTPESEDSVVEAGPSEPVDFVASATVVSSPVAVVDSELVVLSADVPVDVEPARLVLEVWPPVVFVV